MKFTKFSFVVLIVFALLMIQGVAAGECYELNRHWDIGDPMGYDLAVAPGIAVDASGNTYVTTLTVDQSFSGSIEKIGSDGISSPWGPSYGIVEGTQTYRFPLGIVVDSPRNFVFVTEIDIDRVTKESSFYVHKFTLAGTEAAPRWEPYGTGTFSGFDDPFSLVGLQGAIALDPTGSVYVTSVTGTGETSSGRVLVFNQEGDTLSQWNNKDLSDAEYLPMGIAIDSASNVYISGIQKSETTTVSRIFKFNQNGGLLSQWEVGSNPDMTNFVTGITVDSEGDVYVNQIESTLDGMTTFPRVLKFDSGGEVINQWIIGEPGTGSIDFPMGIVVDAGGHVYVADFTLDMDSFSFSIRVMEYISEYCEYIANLYVSKSAPVSVEGGKTIVYKLSYINLGLGTASNVVLEDSLGPAVTFVSASSPGVYIPASNSVKWELGTLNMGDQGSQTLTVMTGSGEDEGTMITNRATISTSDPEIRLDDNVATSETRITQFNLPPGVELEPNNGGGSLPSIYWETPLTLSYRSAVPSDPNFEVTAVSYHIAIEDDFTGTDSVIDGVLQQDTNDPNLWKSDPITFHPSHGKATTTYTVYIKGNPQPVTVKFSFYIDPAGYIYDIATGERIEGASVWLQRPDGRGGWANVPIGQYVMQPDENPIITKSNGQYQWDVLTGSYRVHVEAPGYFPADSIVVSIPPAVTDLHVGLKSMGNTPVPEFPSTILPATMIVGFLGAVLLVQRTREK